jgi:pyrimidine-nucleoside phosphorylase
MVDIGRLSKRKVIAVLTPMNEPLGCAVGNAMELREAVEMLHGIGPEDYRYHCVHLSAYMLLLGEKAKTLEEGISMAEKAIADGSGFQKFRELVLAQGGDLSFVDDLEKLPKAALVETVYADQDGYIAEVNAQEVGETSVELGAGRAQKTDKIDLSVGIKVLVKIGDKVSKGQPLFEVHAQDKGKQHSAIERLKNAVKYKKDPVKRPPYFHGVIGL